MGLALRLDSMDQRGCPIKRCGGVLQDIDVAGGTLPKRRQNRFSSAR